MFEFIFSIILYSFEVPNQKHDKIFNNIFQALKKYIEYPKENKTYNSK